MFSWHKGDNPMWKTLSGESDGVTMTQGHGKVSHLFEVLSLPVKTRLRVRAEFTDTKWMVKQKEASLCSRARVPSWVLSLTTDRKGKGTDTLERSLSFPYLGFLIYNMRSVFKT